MKTAQGFLALLACSILPLIAQDVIPPTAIDLGTLGDEISVLTLDTIGSAVEDTELGIYDAAGNLLDENDDIGGGVLHSEVVAQNLAEGTYYVAVSTYNTAFGDNFFVSGGGESGEIVLNYSDRLDLAGTATGSLAGADAAGGVAWFSFEIEVGGESQTLEIAALSNGTVSGGGTYPSGATATLEALPNPGYAFIGWSGDASGNDNPLAIVMDGDRTVGATFARDVITPAAIDLGILGERELTLDTIGSAVGDTELGIYDAAGILVGLNDDIGGGIIHSRVVVGNLPAGTYYAAVSAYNTTFGPADFAVSGGGVSGEIVLNYSDGLDLTGSAPASLDGADAAGGVAWFSFEIVNLLIPPPANDLGIIGNDTSVITLDTSRSEIFATELGLYDASGNLLDSAGDPGAGRPVPELRFETLPAGTYYVAASAYNTSFRPRFDVNVLLSQSGEITLNYNGGSATASVDQFVLIRWFSFEIEAAPVVITPTADDLGIIGDETSVVTLDTFGSVLDTEIGLYDAAGNLLDNNDDAAGETQSELADMVLAEGTYYVAVSTYDTTFGPTDFAVFGGNNSGEIVLNYSGGLDLAGTATGSLDVADEVGGVAWFSFEIGVGVVPYTLEIRALSNGTVSGGGTYQPGATATLEALPNPGYVFTGWSGDASGNDNPLTIVMDGDRRVGATFAQDVVVPPTAIDLGILGDETSELTLDTIGSAVGDTELGLYDVAGNLLDDNDDVGEGISHSALFPRNLAEGTYYAAVSAYNTTFGPAGFAVAGGGESGEIVLNYSDGLDLTGSAPASLDGADAAGGVAWFSFEIEVESHTLEIAALSNGTVSGGGTYPSGATATLEAFPNPGYVFTGWSGDASGNDNPLTIVMDGDRTVGATFAQDVLITPTAIDLGILGDDLSVLTLDTIGSAVGDTELGVYDAAGNLLDENDDIGGGVLHSRVVVGNLPEGTYYAAVSAYNTAFGPTDFAVSGGGVSGGIVLNYSDGLDVAGVGAASLDGADAAGGVAWFSFEIGVGGESHTIEIASLSNGTVSGGGTYRPGATATLEALPDFGYVFTGWSGDASGNDNPLTIVMDGDRTVGATFAQDVGITDLGTLGAELSVLTLDTIGSAVEDTELGLYDAAGNLLDENDDIGGGVLQSEVVAQNLAEGTYYVAVSAYNTTFGPTDFAVFGGNNSGEIVLNYSGGLDLAGTATGSLDVADEVGGVAWFSFDVGPITRPAEVGPLEIRVVGGDLTVGFAAQDGWSYGLETSTDLQNWSAAPEAVFSQDNGAGTLVLPVDGQDELYLRVIGSAE